MKAQLIQIKNSGRKQVPSAIILILVFFVLSLIINEVYNSFLSTLHIDLPVKTENRINISLYWNSKATSTETYNSETEKREITKSNFMGHSPSLKGDIQKLTFVEAAGYFQANIIRPNYNSERLKVNERNIACDADFGEVFEISELNGRWFNEEDMNSGFLPVVITAKHAEMLNISNPRDHATFTFRTKNQKDIQYKVVGIIEKFRKSDEFPEIFPFFFPYQLDKNGNIYDENLIVKVKEGTNLKLAKEQIKKEMKKRGHIQYLDAYDIFTLDELMHQKFTQHLRLYSIEYGIIFMLICFVLLVLFGNSWSQTSRRIKEMGIRRSIGATRLTIIFHVLSERFIFFFVVMTVSVLLYLNLYTFFKMNNPFISAGISLLIIFFTMLLATLIPAIRAGSIHPVEALAEE